MPSSLNPVSPAFPAPAPNAPLSHEAAVTIWPRHGTQLTLPPAFWIWLALTTPFAGLGCWHLFGLGNHSAWQHNEWGYCLTLGSAALMLLLHAATLAMLFAESRPTRRLPRKSAT